MSNAFEGLEPRLLWESFQTLTSVPRPSGHEEKVREVLVGWAKEHGFEPHVDEVGNLLIKVAAAPGKEGHKTLILQGHLDMVAEKNNDVVFDFLKEGIRVVRDGDWLKADGTTLGADNGIGLAMAMALALDPDVANPPLELFFTIEEETGLVGATSLKPGFLSGERLLNIDSEEEGALFVGCAGGCDTDTALALDFTDVPDGWEAVVVRVKGLIGGHSGLTIHENRGNALKFLATWLHAVAVNQELGICEFGGGDKHNAIPREAEAIVVGPAGLRQALEDAAAELKPALMQEFGRIDGKFELLTGKAGASEMIDHEESLNFLHLVIGLPHGVDTMSKEIEGLVETSTNLARINWEEDEAVFLSSSRSSVASALERLKDRIHAIAEMAGGEARHGEGYPGWQPNLDSPLLAFAKEQFEKLTGKQPNVTAIHAGLECGIIGEAVPGLDMLSMGPTMHDVHSPDERLSISSTNNVYEYLKALVNALD